MNYYQPYQRPETGQWFFAMINDGKVFRVGLCATDACPGHATADEAAAHYRQHILDQATYYGPDKLRTDSTSRQRTQHKCQVCDAWTVFFACYGPGALTHIYLCPDHLNREGLEQAAPAVGTIASSY